ncbi:MAG: Replicative DNA helicase DnaC [Microgenomates group bacterium GW2011_GWF2_47_9]|nr:MAG: Replicative DNA helicase DnaC [Microgenomates group bacterium GW2011_GWF2_47_9]
MTSPSSPDVERALIGALMLDPKAYVRVHDIIDETCLFNGKYATLFRVIKDTCLRGESSDIVTISDNLRKINKLDYVGGNVALAELVEYSPSSANIEHYAKVIREKSNLRRIVTLTSDAKQKAETSGAKSDDIIRDHQRALVGMMSHSQKSPSLNASEMMTLASKSIHDVRSSKRSYDGIPTGFGHLDDLLLGLRIRELSYIAARPSQGKSAFAIKLAKNAAMAGWKVGTLSLEMTNSDIGMRLISEGTGIPLNVLRTRTPLGKADFPRIESSRGIISSLPMFFDDNANITIDAIYMKALQWKWEYGIDMLIVDHIGLIKPDEKIKGRTDQVSYWSQMLKVIAKDVGIHLCGISQLSRKPEERGGDYRPMMSDLRDSGGLEQDADVVMMIWRPAYYCAIDKKFAKKYQAVEIAGKSYDVATAVEVSVQKNRNGPTGCAALRYDGSLTRFTEYDHSEPQQEAEVLDLEPAEEDDLPF